MKPSWAGWRQRIRYDGGEGRRVSGGFGGGDVTVWLSFCHQSRNVGRTASRTSH